MARKRRRFCKGQVYFLTMRLSEGLAFSPNRLIRRLIKGVIARAQELYPYVTISHYVFMGNHYHALVVLEGSAENLSAFCGYIDGELASLFNRLTGRAHHKFWSCRFDAKPILDAEAVLEKITYIYLNPVLAYLVERAEHWEGASSLSQFLDGKPRFYQWVSSSLVTRLPRGPLSNGFVAKTLESFGATNRGERELKLDPYAWKKCFPESFRWRDEAIRERILSKIKAEEESIRNQRLSEGKKIIGCARLRLQSVYQRYMSKEYKRNSLCIATDEERRTEYKQVYRSFCELCREVWRRRKLLDYSLDYPPGAFWPSFRPAASIVTPA
jgi:REP element-mobilizing transposase RayT